jgi:predicted nucleic acid-binding protein
MPFVIDASVAACWLLPDEGHDIATAAFSRLVTDHALVPSLWWFEMRSLFIVNERRGWLDHEKTSRALALLSELPIRLDHTPDSSAVLQLAWKEELPADSNARTAALSAMTRVVSMRRWMVLRRLPGNASADGGGRLLVAGVPLASVGRVERVMFAVVNAGG